MAKLPESEEKILQRMYKTIVDRGDKNARRVRFSNAEERLEKLGFTIPSSMEDMQTALNWPQKAVEVFASRQIPQFFSIKDTASQLFSDLEDIYSDNNFNWLEPQIIESADLLGVAFVFTTLGDPDLGEPEVLITPKTALTATCLIDPRSRRVVAALELLEGKYVNFYRPGVTHYVKRTMSGWDVEETYENHHQRVLCTPYVHDASLTKPFGRSRLTNTVMDLTMGGVRTLLRQEVSAEFYQAPRLALLGADDAVFTDKHGNPIDPWDVLTGAVWAVPDVGIDDDPEVPEALRRAQFERFPQMSMQPFSDQYRLIASAVSGATSIPLHYLGVVQDSNPTSAQAIEAMEVDLVNSVKAQNRSLSLGRRELALDVLTALNGDLPASALADLRSLVPRWGDPRTRSVQEQSQFVATQVGAGNMQPGTEATLRQLPLEPEDVRIIAAENQRARGESVFRQLLNGGQGEAAQSGTGQTQSALPPTPAELSGVGPEGDA